MVTSVILGDWWQLKYDNLGAKNAKFLLIHAGKFWIWSIQKDEIFYSVSQLVHNIKSPIITYSRGHLKCPKIHPGNILQTDFSCAVF